MTSRIRQTVSLLTGASLMAMTSHPAFAQNEFSGLGDLAGGTFQSTAAAVNADGSVVVGSGNSVSGTEAFRWTASGGMIGLGDLAGGSFFSVATSVSADGSVVIGYGRSASGREAFRWTAGGGMVGLGDLPGGSDSVAFDVNADGSVVVGQGNITRGGGEAFRWTQSGGMQGLGDLAGGSFFSVANGVNADGSVVIGQGTSGSGREAFRWTQSGGMQGLGDLAGWSFSSAALGVNADGSVVIGSSYSASGIEAFRWTQSGGMQGLGDLAGGGFSSAALGVNADGSVIVGQGQSGRGTEAFRWLEGTGEGSGMQSVADLLTDDGVDLGNWYLLTAFGVSDDGKVIVGRGINPDGFEGAWKAVIGTGLISIADVIDSLSSMSGAAQAAKGLAQADLDLIMNVARHFNHRQNFGPTQGTRKTAMIPWSSLRFASNDLEGLSLGDEKSRQSLWTIGGMSSRSGDTGDDDTLVGAFGISQQVSSALRFGIGAHLGDNELLIAGDDGNDSERTTQGLQTYVAFESESSPLRLYMGAITTRLEDDLVRNYLNGVEPVSSKGSRDGIAHGGSVVLGLRYPAGGIGTIMPFAGYEATRIILDGYEETTGPFPATYDSLAHTTEVAKLGVELEFPMSGAVNVWGSLARAHQLDDELPGLSGHIPLLASDFALGGTIPNQDWTEARLGLRGQIRENVSINVSFDTDFEGGSDPRYGGTIGFNIRL